MGETQSRPLVDQSTTKSSHSNHIFANVLQKTRCDDSAVPPPPLPSAGDTPPPPPPSAESGDDAIAKAAQSASAFTNPGPYEQAVSDGKRMILLDTFEGFRCEISKQVSPFMAVIHSFHLGTLPDGRKNTYSFLTQVADDAGLLMARADPSRGAVDCRVHRALLGGLAMAKIQAGVSMDGQGDQLLADVDFGGLTFAGNFKYGSMGGQSCYGMSYMQAIHPNISMGGEGLYLNANQNFMTSYSVKFNWKAPIPEALQVAPTKTPGPPGMPEPEPAGHSSLCLTANMGHGAITANYKQTVQPNRLTLGAELQFGIMNPAQSQVLLGAEYKWQRSKLNLVVDGGGKIQSILEAKYGMEPGSPTLLFAAEMDHYNNDMKFGYGCNFEG